MKLYVFDGSFLLTNFGVYEGNIYDDDATISTPHRE